MCTPPKLQQDADRSCSKAERQTDWWRQLATAGGPASEADLDSGTQFKRLWTLSWASLSLSLRLGKVAHGDIRNGVPNCWYHPTSLCSTFTSLNTTWELQPTEPHLDIHSLTFFTHFQMSPSQSPSFSKMPTWVRLEQWDLIYYYYFFFSSVTQIGSKSILNAGFKYWILFSQKQRAMNGI